MQTTENDIALDLYTSYLNDWNKYARDVLNVKLDSDQQECLYQIQINKKTSISSGHARGKDFLAAVASTCFLYTRYPSRVISTAPTGRQVISIMMAETRRIHAGSRIKLPGNVYSAKILVPNKKRDIWDLTAFKAADKSTEAWTGFHSPNLMVVVTEATGISDETFQAIEGLLTGDSKLLIVFNPNQAIGEAYRSAKSKYYKYIKLSCLNAPNVVQKKTVIPGQVDYEWVAERVERWCTPIKKGEMSSDLYDFKFDGKYYRPNDYFKIKVLGEFPGDADSQVIPLRWLEMAVERWQKVQEKEIDKSMPLKLGVDVSGMGRDRTIFAWRHGPYVEKLQEINTPMDQPDLVHMDIAGRVKNAIKEGGTAYLDSIGEGAGVHSRLIEMNQNSVSAKFSESAKGYIDATGERTFANMRAFCYWSLRDALDPKYNQDFMIPPDGDMIEELTAIKTKGLRSDGSILLEPKEKIRESLGRSPDKADALALTFFPRSSEGLDLLITGVGRQ